MGTVKPAHVQNAIRRGDTEALKKMGRKGGLQAAENRARRNMVRQHEAAKRAAEDRAMQLAANEHVLDPDGNPVGGD